MKNIYFVFQGFCADFRPHNAADIEALNAAALTTKAVDALTLGQKLKAVTS